MILIILFSIFIIPSISAKKLNIKAIRKNLKTLDKAQSLYFKGQHIKSERLTKKANKQLNKVQKKWQVFTTPKNCLLIKEANRPRPYTLTLSCMNGSWGGAGKSNHAVDLEFGRAGRGLIFYQKNKATTSRNIEKFESIRPNARVRTKIQLIPYGKKTYEYYSSGHRLTIYVRILKIAHKKSQSLKGGAKPTKNKKAKRKVNHNIYSVKRKKEGRKCKRLRNKPRGKWTINHSKYYMKNCNLF